MSDLKIAACPFCEGECVLHKIFDLVYCKNCSYRASRGKFKNAIRAHNAVARRLDPARVLRVLGGMKGTRFQMRELSFSNGSLRPRLNEQIQTLDASMDKIRNMAKEQRK